MDHLLLYSTYTTVVSYSTQNLLSERVVRTEKFHEYVFKEYLILILNICFPLTIPENEQF